MSNYSRGAAFERVVKADLENDGYLVLRSAGSNGVVDLMAVKPGDILMIQAKLSGTISPLERANLLRTASWVGALPIVAYKHRGTARPFYRWLTGTGPKDYVDWTADELEASIRRHPAGKKVAG